MKGLFRTGIFAVCGVFCAILFSVTPARADMAALKSSDNQIWVSGGGSFFDYKEPAGRPTLPDSERGWLGSAAIGADFLTDSGLYASFEGATDFGNAPYNGAFLDNPSIPLTGTTHETIYTADGRVGQSFHIASNMLVIPYVELGYRSWRRDLGAGQIENYENGDVLGGVRYQIAPTNRLILSAYGSAGSTFAPQMKTFGTTYELGENAMYKVGAKIGFDVTPRVELFSTLDYDHFRYTQSSVINGLYEPSSHTEDTIVRTGIAYHFR